MVIATEIDPFIIQQTQKTKRLLANLLNQLVLLEGKKGKGKTLSGVAICYNLREMFNKPVVIIGAKMGLREEFGPHIFLSEKEFVTELDKIATITNESSDGVVGDAVEKALKSLGVNIYNVTLVFDEATRVFDSRTPSDKMVRVFGYFVQQSRHYLITILVMVPNRDMIDKRVRRQFDWFGRCSTTCRTDPLTHTCIRVGCPHITTTRFIGGVDRFKFKIYGPSYWPMFDSWAMVGFRAKDLQIGRA